MMVKVRFNDQPIQVRVDGAALVSRQAALAENAADRSQDAADFAEGFTGPVYASVSAGEAATTPGQIFRVSNGDGPPETTTAYRRTSGGSVEQSPLATTAALASTDPGKGAALSKWKRPDTGGVERDVREELIALPVTPEQFGAAGDDTTDDTAALKNALAAAAGNTLRLKRGTTYLIASDELVMEDNTILDMNGATLHFTVAGSKRNLAVGNNCSVFGGTITNTTGTPGLQGTFQTPITIGFYGQLVEKTGVVIRDMVIETATPGGNGIGIFGSSNNIEIDNITFPDNSTMAIGILAHWSFDQNYTPPYSNITTHPHNLKITNIKAGSLTYNVGNWRGVVFLSACYNCDVSNVYAENFPTGMGVIVYAGDWGFQFGTAAEQALGFASTSIRNVNGQYLCAVHVYGLNPLEAVQKRWPGSIVIENVGAYGSTTDPACRGIRLDGCDGVQVRDCYLHSFYDAINLGGVVTDLSVENSRIVNSISNGFNGTAVSAGSGRIRLRGNYFKGNNTGSLAARADVNLANIAGCILEQNEWDSPGCSWNVRAASTVTRLRLIDNHTTNVGDGPCYSLGASADNSICVQYQGNTSSVSPTNGVRGGQILIPALMSTRVSASDQQSIIYYSAAPDRGTWNRGDICWNSQPVAGSPRGWQCTTSGSPGTWTSMGNL